MSARYPNAAPARDASDMARLDDIDARVRDIATSLGACEMRYPALIARTVLEHAEYPKAFPHLLMSASRVDCQDVEQGDCSTHDHSVPTGWCLSPAVCYHAYAQLAGRVLADPVVISARGRCFRAERESAPGIRQIEFEMREIVLVGSPDWLAATVEKSTRAIEAAARGMDLSGEWEAAEDPFFLPAASGKALMQRLLKVKVEYQWPRAGGLALASINRHGTFFGERFDITTPHGQPIHTACVAVGLDRWAHASNVNSEFRSHKPQATSHKPQARSEK